MVRCSVDGDCGESATAWSGIPDLGRRGHNYEQHRDDARDPATLGTTTSGTAFIVSATTASLTTSKTNVPWTLSATLICRTIGTSGTAVLLGTFLCDQVGVSSLSFGGQSATIATTTAQGVWLGATTSAAGGSLTTEIVLVEAVNYPRNASGNRTSRNCHTSGSALRRLRGEASSSSRTGPGADT